jgi:NAD(P)-dependent dehydrogenase (short-subunit alcohol dehydrogenase family)
MSEVLSRFNGFSVLVTGAARGFGRLAAEAFAREGARLVISDILAPELEETARHLRAAGVEVVAHAGDIGAEETAPALVAAALKSYGRLDVALNNAGVVHPTMKLPKIDAATMERMLRINLMGVFFAMRAEIPVMEGQGSGVILNVSSVAGLGGAPLLAAYAASKHAVIGLTKTAAAESARKGLRINAICPAFTDTPMLADSLAHIGRDREEALARMVQNVPMGRVGQPGEIVQAMLWMCAPENSFMTGQALAIDGGLTAL